MVEAHGMKRPRVEAHGSTRSGMWRLVLIALSLPLSGCTNSSKAIDQSTTQNPAVPSSLITSLEYPVAYWTLNDEQGQRYELSRSRIDSLMIEMTGRVALQEALLDEILVHALKRRGIQLPPDAIERERSLMMSILSEDETEGYRLLEEIRLREGLGPVRFTALLKRNAALRQLIKDQVELREEAVFAAWDTLHGPRRIARVVVTPNLLQAREATELIRQGSEFTEVAARFSTDSSAKAGGLLQPISRLDPSWPTAFRETLWALEVGGVSEPVLVDGDYLVITYVDDVPGDGVTFEDGRLTALKNLRRGQERLLMDAEASQLLNSVEIDVIDSELDQAWKRTLPGSGL